MPVPVCRSLVAICGLALAIGAIATDARAGGFNITAASVEINDGGSATARPGDPVGVSFIADTFAFGSSQYSYVVFAVVPEKEPIARISLLQANKWSLYGLAMGTSEAQSARGRDELRYKLSVVAPSSPGKYKIIYNRYPLFTDDPLDSYTELGRSFAPSPQARAAFSGHIMRFRTYFDTVATFSVAAAPPVAAITPPTLYLKVNGEIPAINPIRGGTVERPLVFSWRVGDEFRLPKSNLTYRSRMLISGDEWTDWSPSTRSIFFFLPRGSHEFRVQAKYDGPEGTATSQIARVNFFLSEPLVARPSKEALAKPATIGPMERLPVPDIGKVYSGSRALLFGISGFGDLNFSQLPHDRIAKDISTLGASLARNGFEVKTILGPIVTAQDVRLAIDDFIKTSRDNERLFIYFSSHGFADPTRPADGYIATTDCRYRSASATCLPLGSFRQQLNEAIDRKVRQVVVAVDSCFSGLGVIVKSPPDSNLAELARRQGIHMLTAGMEDQKALIDDEFSMSTFTHFLAKGLDGHANLMRSGVVSLTELFLYVQYAVAHRTRSSQIPMMGRVYGSGEMLFRVPARQQVAQ